MTGETRKANRFRASKRKQGELLPTEFGEARFGVPWFLPDGRVNHLSGQLPGNF